MPQEEHKGLPFMTREHMAFDHGSTFSLVIDIFNQTAQTIIVRGFTREGPFTYTIPAAADGAPLTEIHQIPDIPVMLSVVATAAAANRGSSYVRVDLGINGTRAATLCQGYPNLFEALSWPSQPIPTELQRHGEIQAITGTNPAAGAEISITVPTGHWWRLKALRFGLVTDATVATRRPRVDVTIDSIVVASFPSVHSHTASTTVLYVYAEGIGAQTDGIGLISINPMLTDLILPPASTLTTVTANLQAADDYAAPTILVERFLMT